MSDHDVAHVQATRLQRQALGLRLMVQLHAIQRNAHTYAENNDIFVGTLAQVHECLAELLAADGTFELRCSHGGLVVNRQSLRPDASLLPIAVSLCAALTARCIVAISADALPPAADLRALVRLFAAGAPLPGARGCADRTFEVLKLKVREPSELTPLRSTTSLDVQLSDTYSRAVAYVSRYIELLRHGGQPLPVWAASHLAMELVDLQRAAPRRTLQITTTKAGAGAYWGFHAANVALLAIGVGTLCRMPKRSRHELAMAALFHDVGVAALPESLLLKPGALDAGERAAVDIAPLFGARAMLRERDVTAVGLARALAVFEAHHDEATASPFGPGAYGRIVRLCEAFDAMTTTRPYRQAMGPREALEKLAKDQRFCGDHLVALGLVVRPLLD